MTKTYAQIRRMVRTWANNTVEHHHVGKSTLGAAVPWDQVKLYAEALGISVEEAAVRVAKQYQQAPEFMPPRSIRGSSWHLMQDRLRDIVSRKEEAK